MNIVWFLISGVAMGVLSGLLGIGGGVVAVPLMMYGLKMNTKLAMGTSLAVIVPVAVSGSYKHFMQDHVNLGAAALIAVSGIIFAYIGAVLNKRVPERWLRQIFAVFMIVIAVKMLVSSGGSAVTGEHEVVLAAAAEGGSRFGDMIRSPVSLIEFTVTGALMGTLSGMLGIGGGVVAVPLLMFLVGMDPKMAMGTSLAVIVPVAISGCYKQFRQGNVNFKAAALIAVAGIPAAYLGAHLNGVLPKDLLTQIFAVFLIFIGIKMLCGKKDVKPVASPEPIPVEVATGYEPE